MNFTVVGEVVFASLALALALLVAFRAELTRALGGKVLAFIALFILPSLATWIGFNGQMDRSESTQFCLSCHVMSDYGKSLSVDDPSFVPAVHFQNRFVPRTHACYTCHTDYAMVGGVRAKLEGLHHVYVQYLGTLPKPEEIKLYHPYKNRECLHCHAGTRRLPGLLRFMEKRRPGHPHPDSGESRVCQAAISAIWLAQEGSRSHGTPFFRGQTGCRGPNPRLWVSLKRCGIDRSGPSDVTAWYPTL